MKQRNTYFQVAITEKTIRDIIEQAFEVDPSEKAFAYIRNYIQENTNVELSTKEQIIKAFHKYIAEET